MKPGDLFRIPSRESKVYRVRKVTDNFIWYSPNYIGAYPPRGTILKAYKIDTANWIQVPSQS